MTQSPERLFRSVVSFHQGQYQGRRRRAVYAITDQGRAAFRTWLATPSAPLVIHNESMLEVSVASGYFDGTAQCVGRTPILIIRRR